MGFAFLILLRVLFVACMVFVIGYVFGPFSGKPVLRTITRVAAVLVIVLFVATNIFAFRVAHRHAWHRGPWQTCEHHADSLNYSR